MLTPTENILSPLKATCCKVPRIYHLAFLAELSEDMLVLEKAISKTKLHET